MLKGLGDLGNIMKLQRELKKIQKQLKKSQSDGQSGDGMVKATVNGEFMVQKIEVDEEMIKAADKKQIEKAITTAINDAVHNSKQHAAEEMKKVTGGMNIPGMDGML
jgi:DNA-binding YbaB/EbfC family protein